MATVMIHGKEYAAETVMLNVHEEGKAAPVYVGYLSSQATQAGYCVQTLKVRYPNATFYIKESTAADVARIIQIERGCL